MQVQVCILGECDKYNRTVMTAVIRPETGKLLAAKRCLEGYSASEAKAVAVGFALDVIQNRINTDNIVVYTDDYMQEAAQYENGTYKSCSQLLKDYISYIKRLKKKIKLEFASFNDIEEEKKTTVYEMANKCRSITSIQGNIFKDKVKIIPATTAWGKKLEYSITIYKPDGTVFGRFDEKSHFDCKNHAAWFAGWYIKEAKDPKSVFYKYKVVVENLTPIFSETYERVI